MTKDELLVFLSLLRDERDIEKAHSQADELLLAYIGDDEIKAAYEAVPGWYA